MRIFLSISSEFCNFVPEIDVTREIISNFQFTAIVVMLWLTLMLAFMKLRRTAQDHMLHKTRWLMASGTIVLAMQFLLQYTLRLRDMGQTQALMLNLLMFVPAAWLISCAVLYLQRQGRLSLSEWMVGGVTWVSVTILIVAASLAGDGPFFCNTPLMRLMEHISAVVYFAGQAYYVFKELAELGRMRQSLKNYYDHDKAGLLRWMTVSIWTLALMGCVVPVVIVIPGPLMFVLGLFVLGGIGYLVVSFRDYVIGKGAYQVMEAQNNDREEGIGGDNGSITAISAGDSQRVERTIRQWLAKGRYLQQSITMPVVVSEMGISQQLLRSWLRAAGYESYADWMQQLRIEHAKQLLKQHPEYSIEHIAEACGFRNRSYFHTVFRQVTGMTPAQYLEI